VKKLISVVLVFVCFLNSGCAVFDAELHNRGGYLDKVLDDHWFKADSKRMRALRAFALQASLARIASVAPKNDPDRQLMAIRIGNASARAQNVISCGFGTNPATGVSANTDPCFYFDSLMVDYTTALFDLAMVSFPIEDTQKLLNIVVGGVTGPVAALDMLNALVGLAQEALKYGRVIGAIYRDTVELEVQVWLSSPSAPQELKAKIPEKFRISDATVLKLKTIYDRGNDNMNEWVAEMGALRTAGYEPIPDEKFIYELSSLITHLCGLITPAPGDKEKASPAYAGCIGDLITWPKTTQGSPPAEAAKTSSLRQPGQAPIIAAAPFGYAGRVARAPRRASAPQANASTVNTERVAASIAPNRDYAD
jgi:hypothetical protein